MVKPNESGSSSKLTRREFLETSLTVGVAAIGIAATGIGCQPAPTQEVAPAAPTPQPATPPAVPKEPYTVEFWQIAQGAAFQETMAEAIKEFEEANPSIKVSLTEQPAQDLRAKAFPILTDGGPGPDVLYDGSVQSATYAGFPFGFIDVTDRAIADGLRDKTPPAPWVMMEVEGKFYGIPWGLFPFYLVYNKNLYEAAGITDLPETWEDLSEVISKIHDPSKDTFGFLTYTDRFAAWLLETLWYDSELGYFEGSEDFLHYDVGKPITITKPEAAAGLEYMRSLGETAPGGLEGNFGVGLSDALAMFGQGNLAHIFTLTILLSQLPDHNPDMVPHTDFDVMVFPKGPKRRGLLFSNEVIGITKLAKDPDACWEFIKFLSDWEGLIAPSAGMVPVRQDVEVRDDFAGSWLVPVAREHLETVDIFPQAYFKEYDSFRLPLADEVQAYYLGEKTAQEALEATAAQAEAALAE